MKSFKVVFTPRAERQLASIYRHIFDDNVEARAERFVGRIVADCMALATFPERGTKRDGIRPGLRTKGFAGTVTIAFSIDESRATVAIHGVFYGGRDFERTLRDAGSDD